MTIAPREGQGPSIEKIENNSSVDMDIEFGGRCNMSVDMPPSNVIFGVTGDNLTRDYIVFSNQTLRSITYKLHFLRDEVKSSGKKFYLKLI